MRIVLDVILGICFGTALYFAVVRSLAYISVIHPHWWETLVARRERRVERRHSSHGVARVLGSFLSGAIIASAFWGGTAYCNHQRIKMLEKEVNDYKLPPPGHYKKRNVRVTQRANEATFRAQVQSGDGEWIEYTFVTCPGHPVPTNEIQAGVTLDNLEWVEDHEHSCHIMDGRWGGYGLVRGADHKPIIVSLKGETP